MSNWTPKQALSGLMSKFRQSDSDESSSSSSVEGSEVQDAGYNDEPAGISTADVAISPLAMMNENSPEAWLGQFLLKLEAPTSTARGTLDGAKRDPALLDYLRGQHSSAGQVSPLDLLDPQKAADLRARDWGAWWKAQGSLLSYSYSALALSLLGDRGYVGDLQAMYNQQSNMQLHKETHYVLCQMLTKPWPSYSVTEADFRRLQTNPE